jgi:hypothetical protein
MVRVRRIDRDAAIGLPGEFAASVSSRVNVTEVAGAASAFLEIKTRPTGGCRPKRRAVARGAADPANGATATGAAGRRG